jgi:hypothetical protein
MSPSHKFGQGFDLHEKSREENSSAASVLQDIIAHVVKTRHLNGQRKQEVPSPRAQLCGTKSWPLPAFLPQGRKHLRQNIGAVRNSGLNPKVWDNAAHRVQNVPYMIDVETGFQNKLKQ